MKNLLLIIITLLGLALSSSARAQSLPTGEFSVKLEKSLKYLIHLPEGYPGEAQKKWPFVLFLHGAGERGSDPTKVAAHGPPQQAAAGEKLPFILVSPQCPVGQWWESDVLMALITQLEKDYPIDPDRIYVTGLSMGGYGTWALAMRYPKKFAAIAPICGGGIPYLTREITHLPIWTFHGDQDGAVALSETQTLVDELKKRNSPVKFTIYPGVGHNSWVQAYREPEFYPWLLSQNRSKNVPPSPQP